jgi:hypothetical protein
MGLNASRPCVDANETCPAGWKSYVCIYIRYREERTGLSFNGRLIGWLAALARLGADLAGHDEIPGVVVEQVVYGR